VTVATDRIAAVSEIPRGLVTRAASTTMSVVSLSGPAHVTASGQRISTRSRIAPAFVTPAASESILKPRFRRHPPSPVNIIDVKTFFNVFFILVTFLTFLNVFILQTFFYFKKRWQSS